jgi:hypothetical protein
MARPKRTKPVRHSRAVPKRGNEKPELPTDPPAAAADTADVLWGVAEIAKYIKRSRFQVYYLISTGAFDGVIQKIGHKSICASRRKLDALLAGEVRPRSAKAAGQLAAD